MAFPIWEYALSEEGIVGQDESWVRPVNSLVVPERSYTHVAAGLEAACGEQFVGCVSLSTLEGPPDVCQGAIFHRGEALFIANPGSFGFDESRRSLLAALALSEAEVFPFSFRLRVSVAGYPEYSGGVLP